MTLAGVRSWRPTIAQSLLGCTAVAVLTFICFRLRLNLATTGYLYLIVIVVLSLQGSLISSAVVSFIAIGCLAYFFSPPIFSLRVSGVFDVVALMAFLTTSAIIAHSVSRARRFAAKALAEIDERKQADEVLRERAGLLDLTHDTVFVRDVNDVITYWNRGAEELYGWTRQEAIGRASHDLMLTIFPVPLDDINAELFRTGRWEGELVQVKRDGTLATVASRWSLQRDEQGRPLRILETNNDITERRAAEEEVRKQAALLDLAHDAIFVRDLESRIMFWNRGAENTYGWTAEEAIGRVSHELLRTRFPVSREGIDVALEENGGWEGELTHVTRRGTAIVVASRQSLRRDEHGAAAAILEINRDITEPKRAEEALRHAQLNLAHISRVTTMGELTASVAHEVNQPIAAALTDARTCLRWLARDIPDIEEARAAAMRIVEDGTRAAEIITRIRLLFRKSPPKIESVDVNESIRETIVLLGNEATRHGISLRTELAPDLPQIIGDRVQLQQVMMNLIMNGIDAMKDVDGMRELTVNSGRAENEHLLVSVSDTGVGLPPHQADQIFNAFFTTKLQGTGLGLSISRSIIESHGGRLWAAANAPRGASFHVTLPIQ